MQRKISKQQKRLFFIIAFVLLVTGAAIFSYSHLKSTQSPAGVIPPTAQQLEEQARVDAQQKSDYINSQANKIAQPAPVPTSSDAITLEATQDGSSITIKTKLQGFASGKCSLSVTQQTKSYTSSVQVIYQPEYSVCAGFNIPTSAVGPGLWSITLSVTPDGGTALQKTTTLEVK